MLSKTNIYNDNWVDMVFEDRNQQYGAFQLRKKSTHYTTLAVILAIVLFGLTISAPMIVNYFAGEDEVFVPPVVNNDVLPPTPIEDKPIEELPPPPPPPPVKSTIQFKELKVVEQVDPEEEQQTIIEDLKDVDAGKETVKGDPEAEDILPKEPVITGGGGGDAILDVVQQMPDFPGGDEARNNFLKKNLNYPNIALENMIQGKVYVSFVVEKDGRITDVKVVGKAKGFGLDEEAVRVVKMMPRWTPGKQNGNEVRVRFNLPITFKISQ